MSLELKKRIITSIFLISLLTLMFFYSFIMMISIIIVAMIVWVEFYALISKIIINNSYKDRLQRFLYKSISLLYLSILVYFILSIMSYHPDLKIYLLFSTLVTILSDIGGLVFGKIFKGRKLTKISPKKTVSGSIGSFIFSLSLVPLFYNKLIENSFLLLIFITITISLIAQLGDLFISYLKRKAKVKDTSDLLPGHGGLLDRVDGLIFSAPLGVLLLNFI
jgi:phosphatidate cytidylyltransferase